MRRIVSIARASNTPPENSCGGRGRGKAAPSRLSPALAFVVLIVLLSLVPCVQGQTARGRLDQWDIREASGLAASRKHSGVLYTHNDSGDRNRIFAINEWGKYLGTYEIARAQARDWEDMAMGPGPKPGEDYLYIGDIGDNRAYYSTKIVYRVLEPNATRDPSKPISETLTGVEKFEFRFPGHAGNANSETLMVDPHTGDLFIVRKTKQHPLQVFWAKAPLAEGKVIELQEYHATCIDYSHECRDEHYNSPSNGQLVGGDISPSGLGLLIKSYEKMYYWRRSSVDESFFDSDPRILPYRAESQGEAVCWAANEKGYFTLSEGRYPMLYYYPYQPHLKWLETVDLWEKGYDYLGPKKHHQQNSSSTSSSSAVKAANERATSIALMESGKPRFAWGQLLQVRGRLLNERIVVNEDQCLDIPSPSGASCAEDAAAGNCNLAWMNVNGFCVKSCGRCSERRNRNNDHAARNRLTSPSKDQVFPGGYSSTSVKASAGASPTSPAVQDSMPVDSWWEQWMSSHYRTSSGEKASSHGLHAPSTTTMGSSGNNNYCGAADGQSEEGGKTGQYVGPIVMRRKVPSATECCSLCDQVNRQGSKRCDTWSFCKDGLGCGKFQYGTCLLKRSVTFEFREGRQWISGYYSRGGDGSASSQSQNIVLGVRSGPEEGTMDWPLFFQDYAKQSLSESMYLLPDNSNNVPTTRLQEQQKTGGGDWLCQKDLGVLTCPEKKCHALRGHYQGLIVAETQFSSVARCCEACTRARELKIPPHDMGCDVYSFCSESGGCGLMQAYGTCLLKVVSEDPQLGLAWSFDPLMPFTSGRITDA